METLNPIAKQPSHHGENSYPRFWFNSCRHCGGAENLCQDLSGHYRKCINCGRTSDVSPQAARMILQA